MHFHKGLGLGILPLVLASSLVWGQDERLEKRLGPEVRAEVQRLVDSALAVGLPTEPLIDKALEGAAKRASGEQIAAAVRSLSARLGTTRNALGTTSSEAELVAGAQALRAGVPPEALSELRSSRSNQPLLTPLSVLSNLISRGVPAETASAVVLLLADHGAPDADFASMQRDIERDIGAGAPPAAAAAVRVQRGPPTTVPPGNRPPGKTPRGP
jgi:hypothetical protein